MVTFATDRPGIVRKPGTGAVNDTPPYRNVWASAKRCCELSSDSKLEFLMNQQDHIGLLKRLLHYVDTRTTSMADSPWRKDGPVDPHAKHLPLHQRCLSRRHPTC